MKKYLFIAAILFVFFSCKKEGSKDECQSADFEKLRLQLKDSLSPSDFQLLDFSKVVSSAYENENFSIVRIGFKNNPFAENFILLKLDASQHILSGKQIHIERSTPIQSVKQHAIFNGHITIRLLDRTAIINSAITNGFIDAYAKSKSRKNEKETVQEVPLMPDVVVVSAYPKTGGYTSDDLYNLQSMVNGSGTYGTGPTGGSGYYSNSNATTGSTGIFTGSGSGSSSTNPVIIDFEPVENNPAIDIIKYIKCFSSIPDAGAVCTVRILADIPVDKDPNVFFDWDNGSPGHTFLQLTKTNGGQSIQQNIGFYPDQGWKTFTTPAPVKGKFADNAGHEFNASLTQTLTPDKFLSTLTRIGYLSKFVMYDIDDYNCTDFALEVFNNSRAGHELTIPMFDLPGGQAPKGTATPQGLYQKLKQMKDGGDVEAKNIVIPGVKGFTGISHGPCN
ncbi:MAG: hypothetical protein JWR61_2894 [Ferruginibacter sp.]|uniref:hypothetical protein n=1 Tax=Ferruginibacter sp. TaxID=1940288 RepID=UPI00265AD2E4|nr:hypothetical protein [Ferruginibacter sp.]MDB5277939.1 hypothetical protein [Ferruginibacter sp.]